MCISMWTDAKTEELYWPEPSDEVLVSEGVDDGGVVVPRDQEGRQLGQAGHQHRHQLGQPAAAAAEDRHRGHLASYS